MFCDVLQIPQRFSKTTDGVRRAGRMNRVQVSADRVLGYFDLRVVAIGDPLDFAETVQPDEQGTTNEF